MRRENPLVLSPLASLGLCLLLLATACGDGDAARTVLARRAAMPSTSSLTTTGGEGGGADEGGAAGGPNVNCDANLPILSPELENARDLGGTPLGPRAKVACGVLFRGPPLVLDQAGCARAAELGIKTLIDLRTNEERGGRPDTDCLEATLVAAPMPVPYGLGPDDYLNDLHEVAAIATVFHTLGDDQAYPAYFHCTYGRDRTGIVAALALRALGASREAVMQEYLLSKPFVGAFPESLTAVLDEIDARGGAGRVLEDAGISAAELAVLRAHLRVP